MGNTTDFIRGGHSVTFNNGLHGWAGGEKKKSICQERETYIQINVQRAG